MFFTVKGMLSKSYHSSNGGKNRIHLPSPSEFIAETPPVETKLIDSFNTSDQQSQDFDLARLRLLFGTNCCCLAEKDRRTLAVVASQSGDLAMLKYLVESGLQFEKDEEEANSAILLSSAIESGNNECVRFLLANGIHPNSVSPKDGKTPIFAAARIGNLEAAKYLVEYGANPNFVENVRRHTPLFKASLKGHLDIVRYLVEEHRADLNAVDSGGRTAALLAASQGHVAVLSYLTFRGADVTKGDKSGWAPLFLAAYHGHSDVVRFLLTLPQVDINKRAGNDLTALFLAVENGHYCVAELLISRGADVEAVESHGGWTPLFISVRNGNLPLTKLLINNGADVMRVDNECNPPIFYANRRGHYEVAEFLTAIIENQNLENDEVFVNGSSINMLPITADFTLLLAAKKRSHDLHRKSL